MMFHNDWNKHVVSPYVLNYIFNQVYYVYYYFIVVTHYVVILDTFVRANWIRCIISR